MGFNSGFKGLIVIIYFITCLILNGNKVCQLNDSCERVLMFLKARQEALPSSICSGVNAYLRI